MKAKALKRASKRKPSRPTSRKSKTHAHHNDVHEVRRGMFAARPAVSPASRKSKTRTARTSNARHDDVHHVHCMFAVSVDEAARARMFTLDHNHMGSCERRLSYCFKLTSHGHHVSALCECGAEFDLTANSVQYRRRWPYR